MVELSPFLHLLQLLIAAPSFSKQENVTANILSEFMETAGCTIYQKQHNRWLKNYFFDKSKPTLLLNSHHDTVQPNTDYTRNPFEPTIENDKLYGLGSNDAGGALVALLAAFLHFNRQKNLPFNLVYAATAEEEISGRNGIESVLPELGNMEAAIVGEPTRMQMAVAERGLLVLDCCATGVAGHAARNEGVNAIDKAIKDIEWFRHFQFEKKSNWLGAVSMNTTMIRAGIAHNQIPAACNFVVDVRLNECYTHEEVLSIIKKHVTSEVTERSTRISPSGISLNHPLVEAANRMGITLYGSPTTSDMALMPFNSVKIGPGDSARSHSADEFIYVSEIENGIHTYIRLIEQYATLLNQAST